MQQFRHKIGDPRAKLGFSLVEMLLCVSIIASLSYLVSLSIRSNDAVQTTMNYADLLGLIDKARTYAQANHTYVFVGFNEQGSGSVATVVVASNNATTPYNLNGTGPTYPMTQSSLTIVSPLKYFSNVEMINNVSVTSRPNVTTLNVVSKPSITTFNWPLSGPSAITFTEVIQFSPQGVAQIITNTSASTVQWVEADFTPTHGGAASSSAANNSAAILVDGVTGLANIYRN